MKKIPTRATVAREGNVFGEYPVLQIPSLLETGHLRDGDTCLDEEAGEWVPIKTFLQRVPSYAKPSAPAEPEKSHFFMDMPSWLSVLPWFLFLSTLGAAIFLSETAWKQRDEIADLHSRLSAAEATNAEAKEKYHKVLFASRDVASRDLVRGRIILRDASGKRVSLPGIKVRIYRRGEIEAHLAERQASVAEAGGTDPVRLANHFLKGLPEGMETTTSDSDGRFELKVPEPGEYVIQTSIRSAKSGEGRVWFVSFDSRDPLNTPVDITESNVVQQFHALFMIAEGR